MCLRQKISKDNHKKLYRQPTGNFHQTPAFHCVPLTRVWPKFWFCFWTFSISIHWCWYGYIFKVIWNIVIYQIWMYQASPHQSLREDVWKLTASTRRFVESMYSLHSCHYFRDWNLYCFVLRKCKLLYQTLTKIKAGECHIISQNNKILTNFCIAVAFWT